MFDDQELTTGSIMNFIMSTEGCLGPLTFLRIWHDNSGHGKLKGWFLDQTKAQELADSNPRQAQGLVPRTDTSLRTGKLKGWFLDQIQA